MQQLQKIQQLIGIGWEKSADGYYYYKQEVEAEDSTTKLISNMETIGEVPEGYTLSVEILAEAIQIENNQKALKDAWKLDNI